LIRTINVETIESQAKAELEEEFFRQKVEERKEELRQKKHWFPWKITFRIERN
jgi:hypothetical protein